MLAVEGLPGVPYAPPMPLVLDPATQVHSPVQVTSTFATFEPRMVPLPLVTAQTSLAGCVRTVTEYAEPVGSGVLKLSMPLLDTDSESAPLSCKIRPLSISPDTVTPTL